MLLRFAVLAVALLVARPAHAERKTSVMIEPIYLVLPMVDATVEYEVTPHVGIAGVAGIGKVLMISTLYELGGQGNIYLKDDFKGFHVGTEIRAMWGETSIPLFGGPSTMGSSRERRVGIYGGYKWLTRYGFTAVVQVGVSRMDMTSTEEKPWSKIMPMANFVAGWSF